MNNIKEYFQDYVFKDTFEIYKIYDNLIDLENEQLLSLFDINEDHEDNEIIKDLLKYYFKDILNDLSKNPKSKCFKRINKYKEHFNYLPDITDYNIQENITQHRELWINRYMASNHNTDVCKKNFFKLLNHQIYLKNLISPYSSYNGILLFHGVGVGKTCSAITIAETFADYYINNNLDNRIIVLATDNIQVGWKKNIADPSKKNDQCTGSKYLPLDDSVNRNKTIKKNIKSKYEFHTYRRFASGVKKYINKNTSNITDKTHEIELIKEKYSNRVLIIDEVHNIRSAGSNEDVEDAMNYIEKVIRYSNNLKLILLTANPMFNQPSEIIWILNMLRINDNLKSLSSEDYFKLTPNGEKFIDSKKTEFSQMCQGYISYIRGENPDSFPIRLYPKGPNVLSSKNSPSISIFGTPINPENKIKFLKLFGSTLKHEQLKMYKKQISELKSDLNEAEFNTRLMNIQDSNILRQISNIIYPSNDDEITHNIDDTGFNKCFNYSNNKYKYSKHCKDNETIGEFLSIDTISKYSSKIHAILNIIDNTDGIIFIYSNWIYSGIIPMCLALEQHGYYNINGKRYLECSQTDPISYNGVRKSKSKPDKPFIQGRWAVISSHDKINNNIEDILKLTDDDDNINGEKLKIIIGSTVASEGLDFKCIRNIHILDPWLNLNKLEQVIGRGVRNCSHKNLDPEYRNTTIYLHTAYIEDQETIDTFLYNYSSKKSIEIGKIENILKQSSIDLYLSKDINILNKKSKRIQLKPALRTDDIRIKNIHDEKYSRVCSFQPKCNFLTVKQSSFKPTEYSSDTLNYNLINSMINNLKRYISSLYVNAICYSLEEIISNLDEYLDIQEYSDLVYIAIYDMVNDKYIVKSHNNLGYLIYIDDKILFQPNFNNDKLLSPYYRINSGNYFDNKYTVQTITHSYLEANILHITDKLSKQIISKITGYIHIQNKKSTYFNKTEKQIIDMMNLDLIVQIGYIFDHLTYKNKKITLFYLINSLKTGEPLTDSTSALLSYCTQFFIHYDPKSMKYNYLYNDINVEQLYGFFLYDPNIEKPAYYKYYEDRIELFSEVDKITINDFFNSIDRKKYFKNTDNWGFTLFSKRFKIKNSVVLKVIKSNTKIKKKYKFPPGPGTVVNSLNTEWIKEATFEFIKNNLITDYDKLSKELKIKIEKIYTKDDYTFIIENYLRKIDKLYPYDIIWLNYIDE